MGRPFAPHGDWKRSQFFLNHDVLQKVQIIYLFSSFYQLTMSDKCFYVIWLKVILNYSWPIIFQLNIGGEQTQTSPTLLGRSGSTLNGDRTMKVEIPDIVSVSACADLTLPPGAGLCIDTIHGQIFLVSIF